MNKKNQDLFFNEDREETILLTITDANGTEFDVEPIANMEIEELNKEYIAVLPVDESSGYSTTEMLLLIYTEDEDGNPILEGIYDADELTAVSTAFTQFFQSQLQA